MDRDRVREGDFVEFAEIVNHLALIEPDRDRALHRINRSDLPDVPIEHVLVIIVLGLDHLVPWPELPAKLLNHRLIGASRVQFRLEPDVEFADAQ